MPAESANVKGPFVPQLIAALMLAGAVLPLPYDYYTLMRVVVCGVSAYIAYLTWECERVGLAWIMGGLAVVFNPVSPLHLTREVWAVVDVAAIIPLVASVIMLRAKSFQNEPDKVAVEQS